MSLISSFRPSFNTIKVSLPVLGASALAFLPKAIALANKSCDVMCCPSNCPPPTVCPKLEYFPPDFSSRISSSNAGYSFFNIAIPVATLGIGLLCGYVGRYVKEANRPRPKVISQYNLLNKMDPFAAINMSIKLIKDYIDKDNLNLLNAKKVLSIVSEIIEKLSQYCDGVSQKMEGEKAEFNEDKESIIKIIEHLTNDEKDKAKELVKNLKKEKDKYADCIDTDKKDDVILTFNQRKDNISETIRNLEENIKRYNENKDNFKRYKDNISTILKVYSKFSKPLNEDSQQILINLINNNFLTPIEKEKDIMKTWIINNKKAAGMVSEAFTTDREETDLERLRKDNELLRRRLESAQKHRDELGDGWVEAETRARQLALERRVEEPTETIENLKDKKFAKILGSLDPETINIMNIVMDSVEAQGQENIDEFRKQVHQAVDVGEGRVIEFINLIVADFKKRSRRAAPARSEEPKGGPSEGKVEEVE